MLTKNKYVFCKDINISIIFDTRTTANNKTNNMKEREKQKKSAIGDCRDECASQWNEKYVYFLLDDNH